MWLYLFLALVRCAYDSCKTLKQKGPFGNTQNSTVGYLLLLLFLQLFHSVRVETDEKKIDVIPYENH